jgi:hypothetical protein
VRAASEYSSELPAVEQVCSSGLTVTNISKVRASFFILSRQLGWFDFDLY